MQNCVGLVSGPPEFGQHDVNMNTGYLSRLEQAIELRPEP
jgi:hypothetical protein